MSFASVQPGPERAPSEKAEASAQEQVGEVGTDQAGVEQVEGGVPAPVVVQEGPAMGAPRSSSVGEAWVWIGILIVITIVAGLGLIWYRRRVLASEQEQSGEGFMESMRRMRASGEMSEEEFQAIRKRLIGAMSARMKRPERGRGDETLL